MNKSIRVLLAMSFIMVGIIGHSIFLSSCKKKKPFRPNILLVTMDALRGDHLSGYGYNKNTSPNIDALARQGFLFKNAVSHCSGTPVSFGAMFTSLYPSFNGAIPPRNMVLEPSNVTIAEMLSDAGYLTVARTLNPWLSKDFGFDQGFQHLRVKGDWKKSFEIIKANKGKPYFLWIHLMEPHMTYVNHPGVTEKVSPEYDGSIQSLNVIESLELATKGVTVSEAELKQITALYDGMIRWGDNKVGEILDTIKSQGDWDNTMIIFTADHGEELKDHGGMSHGFNLNREVIGIPLIVKLPEEFGEQGKLKESRQIDSLAGHVDIMPTIMDVLGLDIPDTIHGKSLVPLMQGKQNSEYAERVHLSELHMMSGYHYFSLMSEKYHFILAASYGEHEDDPVKFFLDWFKTIVTSDIKNPISFVRKSEAWKEKVNEALKAEWKINAEENKVWLFDARADRKENRNLADQNPEVVRDFKLKLQRFKDKMPELKAVPRPELNKEKEEQLESLGYVR